MKGTFTSYSFCFIFCMCLFAIITQAQTVNFVIPIDEQQANSGSGTGSPGLGYGYGTYDMATKVLSVEGDFYGMLGNSSAAHVHQNVAGANGGVVFGLTYTSGSLSGTFSGSGTLNTAQENALLVDGMYVNIHSSSFSGGEIRGQILRGEQFSIYLDESQASSGNGTGSPGTGIGRGIYLYNTMELSVEGDFNNLLGNTTNAHVHLAPAGSNGGITFDLTYSMGVKNGVFSGSDVLNGDEEFNLLLNNMYVNIHSSTNGGGEIRGQIILNDHCMTDLVVNENPVVSKIHYGTNIHSQGIIGDGSNVTFQGADCIRLLPGFSSLLGGEFNADIAPCPAAPLTNNNTSIK